MPYIHIKIFVLLTRFFRLYIIGILIVSYFSKTYAQNLKLTITSHEKKNTEIINTITYKKLHFSKKSVLKEIDSVSKIMTLKGYINHSYTIQHNDSIYSCYFYLNKKIDSIKIYHHNLINDFFIKRFNKNYNNEYFEVSTNEIDSTLEKIVSFYEKKGFSFVTVFLSNLTQYNNQLSAKLNINFTKKRNITSIVVKGYDDFPKKYLKHFLNLNNRVLFNNTTLNEVYNTANTIPFTTQLKKPEVLFTKDSTILYLYLKKKSANFFDGIIGFSNEKNSNNIKFNGYIDLQLANIFNKGESFGLQWKNNSISQNKILNLKLNTPFIFNSKFNLNGEFDIFKQDSTYTNTKSQFKIGYQLSTKSTINAVINFENSNITTTKNTNLTFEKYLKKLLGASYTFTQIYNNNDLDGLFLEVGFMFGKRKVNNINTPQSKFHFLAEYKIPITNKSSLAVKNKTESLNTSNLKINELYRVGGVNSIRGFDELSFITSKYTATKIEYRYKTDNKSYLYTISDLGYLKNDVSNQNLTLYGLGLGYSLQTKTSNINIGYAVGKTNKSAFNLKNSKLHIQISYPF